MPVEKLIKSPAQVAVWLKSEACHKYKSFLHEACKALTYKEAQAEGIPSAKASDSVKIVITMMKTLQEAINDIPPLKTPNRFGNAAYRTWFDYMKENSVAFVESLINLLVKEKNYDKDPNSLKQELLCNFCDSFGNYNRIDYGTGHEAAFAFMLTILFEVGYFDKADLRHIDAIFNSYLDLVYELQDVYQMEPAGSHGVWGLDDFHFIPFILGSAQLIDNPDNIKPSTYVDKNFPISHHTDAYLYLRSIDRILHCKKGPFAEHSSLLYSISQSPSWAKVNFGLFKMYDTEVLAKFPIVQHCWFGDILSMEPYKEVSKVN